MLIKKYADIIPAGENKMKYASVLFIFALILITACMQSGNSFSAANDNNLQPVDGDSLENVNRRIRLQGIDAPEYKQKCRRKDGSKYRCGLESLDYIKKLMKDKKISCQCEEKPDRYGRELCVCFADNIELNREMVAAGQAVSYRSNRYNDEEKAAKAQKLGVWQGKFMRPELYRTLKREQDAKWCKANPQECKAKKERIKAYKKSKYKH